MRKLFRFKRDLSLWLKCILAALVLIAVNIAAKPFDRSFDMTVEKRYSLSSETLEIIKNLSEDITIYALFEEGELPSPYYDTINELLVKYKNSSAKITLVYRGQSFFTAISEAYGSSYKIPEQYGLIVECGEKYQVISPDELVVVDYEISGETYAPYVSDITLEQQVTNAILIVSGGNASTIYRLTGHNEIPLADELAKMINASNYEIKELNLLETGEIPDDCDLLFLTTPERDYALLENEILTAYIDNGGKVIAAVNGAFADFPMLNKTIAALGVQFDESLIVEREIGNYYPNMSPVNIIPEYPGSTSNEIVQNMLQKNVRTLTPIATGIYVVPEMVLSKGVVPLLITSSSAYGITDVEAVDLEYKDGYLDGPFNIAVSITDYDTGGKAVVIGAGYILDESVNSSILGGNYEFILSCIDWTQDRENSSFVLPTNKPAVYVFINKTAQSVITLSCLLIIPAAIFGAGIVVVQRRGKRGEELGD